MSVLGVAWNEDGLVLSCRPDPGRPPYRIEEVFGDLAVPNSIRVGRDAVPVTSFLAACFAASPRAGNSCGELYAQAIGDYFNALLDGVNGREDVAAVLLEPIDQFGFVAPPDASAAGIAGFEALTRRIDADVAVMGFHAATLANGIGDFRDRISFLVCDWDEDLVVWRGLAYPTKRHVSRICRPHRLKGLGRTLRNDGAEHASGRLVRAGNFLQRAARQLDAPDVRAVMLTGSMLANEPCRKLVTATFEELGLEVLRPGLDATLAGMHACLVGRPMLPYDCGVLIRRSGARNGLGTLVLVRPAAIGDTGDSVLEFPAERGETLEVSFYLRRLLLDDDGWQVSYEAMKSHRFAAEVGNGDQARLRVSMRVDADETEPAGVRVSIDLHDVLAENIVSFPFLRLDEGKALRHPPLHHLSELAGTRWADQLNRALAVLAERSVDVSIEQWYQGLTGRGSSRHIPRLAYLRECVMATGPEMQNDAMLLLTSELANPSEPEDLQAAIRGLFFQAMHQIAEAHPGTATGRWQQRYGEDQHPPTDLSCAQEWFNALSSAVAGQGKEDQIMDRASRIFKFYEYACTPPQNLNIDWAYVAPEGEEP